MEQQNIENYVKFLRALASAERIGILEAIERKGEISASQVEKSFYMEQSTASHHLNILKKAGIIAPRKTGRNIYYHIENQALKSFYGQFINALEEKQQQKIENLAKQKNLISN
jgi:ArsR family transcriptional regulator